MVFSIHIRLRYEERPCTVLYCVVLYCTVLYNARTHQHLCSHSPLYNFNSIYSFRIRIKVFLVFGDSRKTSHFWFWERNEWHYESPQFIGRKGRRHLSLRIWPLLDCSLWSASLPCTSYLNLPHTYYMSYCTYMFNYAKHSAPYWLRYCSLVCFLSWYPVTVLIILYA